MWTSDQAAEFVHEQVDRERRQLLSEVTLGLKRVRTDSKINRRMMKSTDMDFTASKRNVMNGAANGTWAAVRVPRRPVTTSSNILHDLALAPARTFSPTKN